MSNPNTTPVNENEEKAGCLGLGFSFFFPIAGIILYGNTSSCFGFSYVTMVDPDLSN